MFPSKERNRFRLISQGGRNRHGLITAPRRGAWTKQIFRFVDFFRQVFPHIPGKILRLLYDPNRKAPLALIHYPSGCFTYVILTEGLKKGDFLMNNPISLPRTPGHSSRLSLIPAGSLIHSISATPNLFAQYLRSAGVFAILVRQDLHGCLIKMKSGEYRYFFNQCSAVSGTVAGGDSFLRPYELAGVSRHFSFRPRVRAYAKNPVDHPMGGRTKGGTIKKTPKGRPCLNTSTVPNPGIYTLIKKRQLSYKTI